MENRSTSSGFDNCETKFLMKAVKLNLAHLSLKSTAMIQHTIYMQFPNRTLLTFYRRKRKKLCSVEENSRALISILDLETEPPGRGGTCKRFPDENRKIVDYREVKSMSELRCPECENELLPLRPQDGADALWQRCGRNVTPWSCIVEVITMEK